MSTLQRIADDLLDYHNTHYFQTYSLVDVPAYVDLLNEAQAEKHRIPVEERLRNLEQRLDAIEERFDRLLVPAEIMEYDRRAIARNDYQAV